MSKQKIFVTRPDFPGKGILRLKEKYNVELSPFPHDVPRNYLLEHVQGSSALFCISTDKIDREVLTAAGPNLKIVATFSLGFEHIDIEECKKRNIQVCNAPNPVSVSVVAEFTVGLLLAVARKIVDSSGAIKRGEWIQSWSPTWFVGKGLTNATVGIVGMGRIGTAVLKRILPFGVSKVYYHDVFHPNKEAESLGAVYTDFEDLLKNSDFVIAMCNLTEQNRGLFNSRAFSLMKSTSIFINTSRGGVVDQDALINALKNKQIKAAGIDVMYPEPLPSDHELANLPNIGKTIHVYLDLIQPTSQLLQHFHFGSQHTKNAIHFNGIAFYLYTISLIERAAKADEAVKISM